MLISKTAEGGPIFSSPHFTPSFGRGLQYQAHIPLWKRPKT